MMSRKPIDLDRERRIRGILDRLRADLAANPELAERTRAMLAGELACPDLEEGLMPKEAQVSLRLPVNVIDRAEALVPSMRSRPEYEAVRVTRSFVLTVAMLRGLAALEAEARAPGGSTIQTTEPSPADTIVPTENTRTTPRRKRTGRVSGRAPGRSRP